MIKSKLLLMAEGVTTDIASKKNSVFNIIDNFKVNGFPFLMQKVDILAITEREESDDNIQDLKVRIKIEDEQLAEFSGKIEYKDKFTNKLTVNILGLAVPSPGIIETQLVLIPSDGSAEMILDTYVINVENIGKVETTATENEQGA